MNARLHRVTGRGDDGQLLLLVLGYTLIAAVLVTVVVNLSSAFLTRRSLVAAADGAAIAAANQPDLRRIYSGDGSPVLPLSEEGARDAVAQYARDAGLARRFAGFRVLDVSTDGRTVAVTFGARAPMPVVNLVSRRWAAGYPLDATARATSPLLP